MNEVPLYPHSHKVLPLNARQGLPRMREAACGCSRITLKGFDYFLPESQGKKLALTVLYVSYLRDSGDYGIAYSRVLRMILYTTMTPRR